MGNIDENIKCKSMHKLVKLGFLRRVESFRLKIRFCVCE